MQCEVLALAVLFEDSSKRAKRFESKNIYHILKFGAVRLMKGDFKRATEFYDRVITMDPAWSAFAHYNRAYCKIQLNSDVSIESAIVDLKAALRKLENYWKNFLFSGIYVHAPAENLTFHKDETDDGTNTRSPQCYEMMECQLLHHIHTQIVECIEKLGAIDTMNKGEVTTERKNILDLIPGADCTTMKVLQKYSQMGLLFTYNIDVEPKFSYRHHIVFSLVILESVSVIIRTAFLRGMLVSTDSNEVRDMIDTACDIGSLGDSSLGWIPRCVSEVTQHVLYTIFLIRDFSSLVPIKKTKLESGSEINAESSQFSDFARLQAASVLNWLAPTTQEVNSLLCSQEEEISMHMTDVAMNVLRQQISQRIHETIAHGQTLHHEIFSLYNSVASQSKSDLLRFVECIRDLAQLSSYSFQSSDSNGGTSKDRS